MRRYEAMDILARNAERIRGFGVSRLALFGSTARDDAERDSDVDILVDLDEDRAVSLLDIAGLELYLSEILGREVDLARRTSLKPFLRSAILADAIEVFPDRRATIGEGGGAVAPRSPRQRLEDMRTAAAEIEEFLRGASYDSFVADILRRKAVERNIEIISEASRRIPSDMLAAHPEIPWREIAGIGNVLRHGYDIVEPAVLWTAVVRDLAPLRAAVEAMIAAADESGSHG